MRTLTFPQAANIVLMAATFLTIVGIYAANVVITGKPLWQIVVEPLL